jgi:hypothetical protein
MTRKINPRHSNGLTDSQFLPKVAKLSKRQTKALFSLSLG